MRLFSCLLLLTIGIGQLSSEIVVHIVHIIRGLAAAAAAFLALFAALFLSMTALFLVVLELTGRDAIDRGMRRGGWQCRRIRCCLRRRWLGRAAGLL